MHPFYPKKFTFFRFLLLFLIAQSAYGQQLKVKDFAIWGGSAVVSSYKSNQGVFLSPQVNITGTIGSNHQIQGKKSLTVKGNIVSGNQIVLSDENKIQGDIIAFKKA